MEQFTKVNGWMIFSMEKEMKAGAMALNISDYIDLEKSMDKVITNGRMVRTLAEIGLIINIKAMEPITGQTGENIKANGKMEKCMELDFIKNQMENYIQANLKMIKNKAMEYKNQNQEKYIKELGLMANSMVQEFNRNQVANRNMDCGKKGY